MFACICPYCKQETGIGTAALFDKVLNEPQECGRDFLILKDVPTRRDERDAQPSK
jgi:hypothetical protein